MADYAFRHILVSVTIISNNAIWPIFAIVVILFGIYNNMPFWKPLDAVERIHARTSTLDGLRGLLALGIFFVHARITQGYIRTGLWDITTPFYFMLGDTCVATFFMITGFLFWDKVLRTQGTIDWHKLYIGRLFRIAPIYFLAAVALLAIVAFKTQFVQHEPLTNIAIASARWLFGLGILGMPNVNGYAATAYIVAGAVWTLRYEWEFYFSLPLAALLAGRRVRYWFVTSGWIASLIAMHYLHHRSIIAPALFFSGMTVATFSSQAARLQFGARLGATVVVISICTIFICFDTAFDPACIPILACAFLIVCNGNDVFGLLISKAAQRLGAISYSVYLLHGIVLTLLFSSTTIRTFALWNEINFWLVTALASVLVTAAATMSFVFIERPCIELGRSIVHAARKT